MMKTKWSLTLSDVKKIAAAAEAHALANQLSVVIAICDEGGHLLWLQRLDDCVLASIEIAIEKARSSALGKRPSKIYEDIINNGRTAFLSLPLKGLLEGAEPIIIEGQCVGAIGVSGAKSEQDAQIAQVGIAALLQ